MFACPMYVLRALAFTPAAIISDANVCLHSWSVIRLSFASFPRRVRSLRQPVSVERQGGGAAKHEVAATVAGAQQVGAQDRAQRCGDRHSAAVASLRQDLTR